MNKTIIQMLQDIEYAVNVPMYDDLTPYLMGVRDLINFLNNAEYATSEEVYKHIINECKNL